MTENQNAWPEELRLDGVEFSFDKDGDLQIELTGPTHEARWTGHFMGKSDAIKLRDYLQRMLK